jgi:hypothetical protein
LAGPAHPITEEQRFHVIVKQSDAFQYAMDFKEAEMWTFPNNSDGDAEAGGVKFGVAAYDPEKYLERWLPGALQGRGQEVLRVVAC